MAEPQQYILNVGRLIDKINRSIATLTAIPTDFDEVMYNKVFDILNSENIEQDNSYIEHATKRLHDYLTLLCSNSNDFHRVNEFTVLYAALLAEIRLELCNLNLSKPFIFDCVKTNVMIIKATPHVYNQYAFNQ